MSNMTDIIDSKLTSNAIFDIPPIDEEFVLKRFEKAVGMDCLSSKLLKLAGPAIVSSVTKVINLSIKASKFLKRTNVMRH